MNSSHFAPIAALDLDPIKVKLMHEESGEGWSRAYADSMEFEYRRFLYLVKKFPNEQAAPLFDVDVFWHYHILDTMKYAADCEAVFGYFLHHFPYLGLRGEEDLETHHRVGERMRELYEQTYGEQYIPQEQPAHSDASGKFAFCDAISKSESSVSNSKAAFSQPATLAAAGFNPISRNKPAFSQPATSAAAMFHSVPNNKPAFSQPSAADAASFNSARPTLARASQM
jgi:hypothetical protein